jgi:polyisoprenyl-teichoic acid--peptidoglycan teichoic acid transferase
VFKSALKGTSMSRGSKQSGLQTKIPVVTKYPERLSFMPKKPSILKRLAWSLAFVGVTTVAAASGITLAMLTPFQSTAQQAGSHKSPFGNLFGLQYGIGRPVNILVMGIDRVLDAPAGSAASFKGRSDTMLLVRLNPEDGTVSILTIPRDTRVEIPTVGLSKINAANASGGADLAATVVSRTFDDVPVDRYVRVSTEAFRELVELVGGVEVNVPERMQYTDQTQKLKIDLQPGLQTLNGVQAEGFARFRYDAMGDIGRAQRQQVLMKALQKKVANPMMLTRLPQLFGVMQKQIDSDLTLQEMLSLVQFGLQLKPDKLRMVLLPGRFSSYDEYEESYWLMNSDAMHRVMQNYFAASGPDGSENYAPQDLRISVQNASGQPRAARQVADLLIGNGFSNVYIEADWPHSEPETEVVVQQGDLKAAKMLQAAMGFGRVEPNSTGTIDSDLTIRVGQDWAKKIGDRR